MTVSQGGADEPHVTQRKVAQALVKDIAAGAGAGGPRGSPPSCSPPTT